MLHTEQLADNAHLGQSGFFIDLDRQISGPQRQAGLAILQNGKRMGARSPAPLLGEHSFQVLASFGQMTRDQFDALVQANIICFEPKSLRAQSPPGEAAHGSMMAAS